jgi:hypothetical protein
MTKSIFRQISLERLSSPEQLDQLVRVTDPMSWLALLALSLVLVAAGVWGVFGSLPTQVTGQGILVSSGGIYDVVAPGAGQMTALLVHAGETVQRGQVVAEITEIGGSFTQITTPYAGRVLELKVDGSSQVDRSTPLLSIEGLNPQGQMDLIVVMYTAPADGKKIQPGMQVQISPSTVRREEYGFMLGEVISVGQFPATPQGMQRVLGNTELIRTLSVEGAPIEVRVSLRLDPENASGYAWSSRPGPPIQIDSGTLCSARVTLSEQRPISLVLPLFK